MEKSCHSTGGDSMSSSSSNTTSHNHNHNHNNSSKQNPSDHFLKHLNKISHKISKPNIKRTPSVPLDHHHHHHHQQHHQNQNQTHTQNQNQNQNQTHHQQQQQQQQNPPQNQNQELQNHHQQQQQQQPPVYNINKSDFRDVVQKLTGSPAHHDRFSTPPPIQPPKAPSSRLQRIRPPPLAHVSNRPPAPLNAASFIPPPHHPSSITNNNNTTINPNNNNNNFMMNNSFNSIGRQMTPLSPLPPFPAVHAAAESPISAYMRYLQSSTPTLDSESKRFSGFSSVPPILSPKWNNHPNSFYQQQQQQQHQHQQQILLPSPNSSMANLQFPMPNSPLGFGRIQSPRSPYPLLSPNLLFSPTGGQLGFPQFPPSPRLPMLSPRWRGL